MTTITIAHWTLTNEDGYWIITSDLPGMIQDVTVNIDPANTVTVRIASQNIDPAKATEIGTLIAQASAAATAFQGIINN